MASNIVAVTAPDYGIPTPAITYSTDGGNTWLFPNKADFPTTLFGGFESTSWLGGAGRGVAYGYDNSTPTNKSCFVAVGSGPGVIGYSTNGGSVWKVATTPADLFQATSGGGGGGYAIAYGKDKNNNNCFVAVGGYDFAKSITGGESWIKQTPTNSNYIYGNLYGVAYGNGTFVAVGGGNVSAIPPGVFPAAISYSTDGGVTWTPVISTTLFSYGTAEGAEGVISSGNGVAYGYDNNNVGCFVAVGDYFNNGNINGQIGYSSDGITWSISSLVDTRTKSTLFNGSGDSVQCVAYDSSNKRFVAGGSVFTGSVYTGLICYSYDGGKTWQTFTDNFNSVFSYSSNGLAFYNNSLLSIGSTTNSIVISSTTTNTWSTNVLPGIFGRGLGIASSTILPPYAYSCNTTSVITSWSTLSTYAFTELSISDASSTINTVVSAVSSQTSIPLNAICIKEVNSGSLIITMQVLYGSAAAAYQGSIAIGQVVLPSSLGGYTLNTTVKPPPGITPPVTSNICFPAGTAVKTDQGDIAIEQIVPGKHTVNGETIEYITQTVTREPYLIKINKDALGVNKPTKPTIISKDHKIEFEGRMIPAYRLLDYSRNIIKVRYTGEILYNVLMKEYSTISVHNLTCETLDPLSPIACKYQGTVYKEQTVEKKNTLVKLN